jgi:hypothetical protein
MKRIIIILSFAILLSASNLCAQTTSNYPFSIKTGLSVVLAEPYKYENQILAIDMKPQINIEVGYDFIKNLTSSLYLGYSNIGQKVDYEFVFKDGKLISYGSGVIPSHAFYYGVSLRYQLLPLLFSNDNLRFSLYPIASCGFVSRSWSDFNGVLVKIDPFFEYQLGVGLGYRFSRKFGIYTECTYGHMYNESTIKPSIGLTLNF